MSNATQRCRTELLLLFYSVAGARTSRKKGERGAGPQTPRSLSATRTAHPPETTGHQKTTTTVKAEDDNDCEGRRGLRKTSTTTTVDEYYDCGRIRRLWTNTTTGRTRRLWKKTTTTLSTGKTNSHIPYFCVIVYLSVYTAS